MGRQNTDHPTMMGSSSIALLQERFKQLQRVREEREKRELLNFFSEPKPATPTMRFEPFASQPETLFPPPPLPQDQALSLSLNSLGKPDDFGVTMIQKSTGLWARNVDSFKSNSPNFGNSEVDTSLHL
ncbi:hypothetical protein Acr_13g0005850 [Actinidia rufa]|uniref:Uncharacterized protein n=1 Tax=Actinidia rufa TaxID=165716 RepID=A0A7J0FKF6_9ERIC|nr:hypothetical protein Acr_13g0005850 [Actinidia rufa]